MQIKYIVLILLMGLATYITRASLFVFSKYIEIPEIIYRSLKYIPIAILTTLIVPGVLMPNGNLFISLSNIYIYAAIVVVITILTTKNAIVSIVLGIGSLVLFKMFF